MMWVDLALSDYPRQGSFLISKYSQNEKMNLERFGVFQMMLEEKSAPAAKAPPIFMEIAAGIKR